MKADDTLHAPLAMNGQGTLAEQVRLLRSACDGMSDSMIVVDREGRLVFRNAAAARMEFDPTADQIDSSAKRGRAFRSDRTTPYARDEFPLMRALRGENIAGESLYIVTPSHSFWLHVNSSPLRDEAGEISGAVAVYRDDTARHEAVEALQVSEARFRQLVETSAVVPFEVDITIGGMSYVGPQAETLFGFTLSQWYDNNFWEGRIDIADRDQVVKVFGRSHVTGEPIDVEYRLLNENDQLVWVRAIANIVVRDDGRRIQQGFVFNITERKKAEEAVRHSQRLLRAIIDSSPAFIYLKDIEGRFIIVNRSCAKFFGVATPEDAVGKTDFDFSVTAAAAQSFRDNDRRVIESRQPIQTEEIVPSPAGGQTYWSVKHPIFRDNGELYAVCGISTDISELKLAEEKIRLEQKFLAETLKAHERDRQLLAYEIHDGLVQDIAAGVMHLESVRLAHKEAGEKVDDLNMSLQLFRRAIDEARRVLSGLRPPILDESGVILAIEYLIAEQQSPELEITFSSNVTFNRLDSLLEGTIFRIVQEALTNIKRHSRSEEAAVRLTQKGNRLHMLIQDWGVGFDPNLVIDDHFGLHGIRKRAALAGGSAEIISVPGEGTRVTVDLPVIEPVVH